MDEELSVTSGLAQTWKGIGGSISYILVLLAKASRASSLTILLDSSPYDEMCNPSFCVFSVTGNMGRNMILNPREGRYDRCCWYACSTRHLACLIQ